MAPDVNSLPASPRLDRSQQQASSQPTSNTASRRMSPLVMTNTSTTMPPPSQPAFGSASQHFRSPIMPTNENTVPMRHPRPLTAAELFLECEKEQEAVVNRLTRELTALRAQSASVASNASISSTSTSASLLPVDVTDPNPAHQLTGATHPTPSRRHRTSSSASSRSMAMPSTTVSVPNTSNTPISAQSQVGNTVNAPHGVSQASAERAAAAGGPPLSRQASVSASGRSTPARQSLEILRTAGSLALPHRSSISRDPPSTTASSTHAQAGTPGPYHVPSPALSPHQGSGVTAAMQHYAETAAYRSEMEIVKAENETLRQQIRALERALRLRRRDSSQSDAQRPESNTRVTRDSMDSNRAFSLTSPPPSAGLSVSGWTDGGIGGVAGPRERSESQSTTASSRRAVGVAEEELRVGESASSISRIV